MNNKVRQSFDKIHAEVALKQETANFLHEKIRQKSGKRKIAQSRFRFAAVCASFVMLFIIGGFSYNLYFTPRAYVDIDVNPSIELSVNRFGRIIKASPYNEEGAAILQGVNVQHMSYEDAVDILIGAMVISDYLKQDGMVSVTIQTDDKNRENNMLGGLQTMVESLLQTHHTSAMTNVFAVNEDVKSQAHQNHMTPAKYLAISELQRVDPTVTYEDCRNHTISEINEMIRGHGGEHHTDKIGDGSNELEPQPAADYGMEENCLNNPATPSSQSMHRNQHEGDGEHGGGH